MVRVALTIGLALMASVTGSTAVVRGRAPSAPASELIPLTIDVEAARGVTGSFVRNTMAEAEAIWREAGIAIEWHLIASARDAHTATLSVQIEDKAARSSMGQETLGWILFEDPETPVPAIHLSRVNALDLLGRTSSLHDTPIVWQHTLLARALGRALAHEIGHYLLRSHNHTTDGLMQTMRPSIDFFSPDRNGFAVTLEQREVAFAHLAEALGCR